MTATPTRDTLVRAAMRLTETAASHRWTGPDPYDGLWASWPPVLVGGRRRRQIIVQVHARAPVDIRKAYRRRHPRLAKALGLFGMTAHRAARLTGSARARELARDALDLLVADRRCGYTAWGYPFDVQTRWSFYEAGTPNVVVTAFAANALLDAGAHSGGEQFTTRARRAARWVLEELWVLDEGYFGYHGDSRVCVHNANLLGAALVHRALGDDPLARERVLRSVERAVSAQCADGSWPYGEGHGLSWVDSFHTGFVLASLVRVREIDGAVDDAIVRGAARYCDFFDGDGRAKLFADRAFPEDAHSAGTGLSTLAALVSAGVVDRRVLDRVSRRVICAVVRRDRAVARRYRWGRTTVWYPRWCDGHVALGLVDTATVRPTL